MPGILSIAMTASWSSSKRVLSVTLPLGAFVLAASSAQPDESIMAISGAICIIHSSLWSAVITMSLGPSVDPP